MLKFRVQTTGASDFHRTLAEAGSKAEHIMATQIKKDTSPFVPALNLSLDQLTMVEGYTVIYPGPFARFLYYGKGMIDPETGSTFAPSGGHKVVVDRNLVFNKAEHAQAQAFWFEASKAVNKDKWLRIADKVVKKGLDKKTTCNRYSGGAGSTIPPTAAMAQSISG